MVKIDEDNLNYKFLSILSTKSDIDHSHLKLDKSNYELPDLKRSQLKIVILGEGAVGKTTLRLNFMGESTDGIYLSTLGTDFSVKYINLSQDHSVMLQIWDIAGQLFYRDLVRAYFDGANGAIVVYDLTRLETFDYIKYWIDSLFHVVGPIPFIVLGNKLDVTHKNDIQNFKAQADGMIEEISKYTQTEFGFSVGHFLSSAITGENVDRSFRILTNEILKQST